MPAERERQDLGHMPLLGSVGGVLWGSQAKSRLVDSNQKEGFRLTLRGSYLKGTLAGEALGSSTERLS